MNNPTHHFPTCCKNDYRELNLVRALDEDIEFSPSTSSPLGHACMHAHLYIVVKFVFGVNCSILVDIKTLINVTIVYISSDHVMLF